MAIDKLEVEILAVGQGSCNVVKGINLSGGLEYLAILDAGGSSVTESPAKEAKKKLEDYMEERATAMGNAAPAGRYADLLLISHSDEDHYTIIQSIAAINKGATIVKNEKNEPVRAKKVKVSGRNRKADNSDFTYRDAEVFAFSAYEYEIQPPDPARLWNLNNYAYIYRANTYLHYDFFMLKTFYVYETGITDWFINATLDSETESHELFLQYFGTRADQVALMYRYNASDDVLGMSMGDKCAHATITKNGLEITIEYSFQRTYTDGKITFKDAEFEFTFLKILNVLKKIPKWYDLFPFYFDFRNFILYIAPFFFEDPPNPDITLADIQNELQTELPSFNSNEAETNKIANTIAFGRVINSISSDRPAVVESLISRAVPGGVSPNLSEPYLEFLRTPDAEYYADKQDVAYGKWKKRLKFYDREYKETGGNKGKSDVKFRNMNSIITITGLNESGPHFIFPGDATVQNMWYNTEANGTALEKGSGQNFLTLPHHGSYETSFGKPENDKKSVLLQFIEKINPKKIYISAGFENHHGHPNIWTMNECAEFFKFFPECDEHVVYYNMSNKKKDHFAYCKYRKPLFTTVTYEERCIVAPSYQLTFTGTDAKGIEMEKPPVIGRAVRVDLKDFPGNNEFPIKINAATAMTDHPIYDFVFED